MEEQVDLKLTRRQVEILLMTLHGGGSAKTHIVPVTDDYFEAVLSIERQFAKVYPNERADWSLRALEVRSR
jgi:hypothetical protein